LHDLIPIADALTGNLTVAEIDRAIHFARSATAPGTLAAYASDYKSWVAFCTERGACPMPPHAGVVAVWLSAQADAGRKASLIGRAAAALAFYSKQAGIDPPVTATVIVFVFTLPLASAPYGATTGPRHGDQREAGRGDS
jgi:hypothetical protein